MRSTPAPVHFVTSFLPTHTPPSTVCSCAIANLAALHQILLHTHLRELQPGAPPSEAVPLLQLQRDVVEVGRHGGSQAPQRQAALPADGSGAAGNRGAGTCAWGCRGEAGNAGVVLVSEGDSLAAMPVTRSQCRKAGWHGGQHGGQCPSVGGYNRTAHTGLAPMKSRTGGTNDPLPPPHPHPPSPHAPD